MNQIQPIKVDERLFPLVIIKWKVSVDQAVKKQQELAIIEVVEEEKSQRKVIKSGFEGKIVKLAKAGIILETGSLIGEIEEECSHSVQLHGLCAVCGKDLTIADYTGSETSRATINMTHDSRGVKISHNEAARIEDLHTSRLLKAKKLSMLLDLDQTVVHATVDDQVRGWLEEPDNPNFPAISEVSSFTLADSPVVYYIKLRPNTRRFLEEMHSKYEMHIYTMGTRNYAHAVANILDPTRKYFKDRILSRDDSGSFIHKSIQRLFPVDQSMVVAIDDRADVWHWSPNLIKVWPYNFFLGIGDINEPMKEEESTDFPTPVTNNMPTETSLLQQETAPIISMTLIQPENLALPSSSNTIPKAKAKPILADNDQDLTHLSKALSTLHLEYFKLHTTGTQKADVATILPRLKINILKGVHLVFSGIIPLGVDPAQQDVWMLATQFGAKCYMEITPLTTHLIARKTGTVKVREAREMQCFVVKPEWLHDSIIQWTHLPEEGYILDPNFKIQKLDVGQSTWTDLDKELAELSSDSESGSGNELGSESFDGLDDAIEAEMEDLNRADKDSSSKRKFDKI